MVYIFPLRNLFGAAFYVHRYAWAVTNHLYIMELNLVCDDVIIVLHCGLWSCLKCAYEADSPPRSKSRGRGSVHINFPRPLHEVEHTSKWQRGFPRGEVLREVHEWVSKSGVERSLNEWVTDSLGLSLWMSHWIIGSLGLSLWMSHWIIGSLGLSLWMSHWITDSLGLSLWMSHWITDSLSLSLWMSHWITDSLGLSLWMSHWIIGSLDSFKTVDSLRNQSRSTVLLWLWLELFPFAKLSKTDNIDNTVTTWISCLLNCCIKSISYVTLEHKSSHK